MARKRRSPFNMPDGKIGDYVVKHRMGTPYIAGKQIRGKVKQTPALKKSKNTFTFLGKVTPELHSDPKMRAMWEASDIEGENARNKITHINFSLVPDDLELTNFRLSPFDRLFRAPVVETVWGPNKVTVTFAPFEELPKDLRNTAVSAHGIVRYYESTAEGYEDKFLIERISSNPVVYSFGGQHTFTMVYDSDYQVRYHKKQLCFTLLIENGDGIAKECSENILLD